MSTQDLDEDVNPFQPGTLSHGLWVATRAMRPIAPRPKRSPSTAPRKKVVAVRLTGRGDSKPQKASKRRAILDWIRDTTGQERVTVDAIEANFKEPVRGHIQKLIEMQHLESVQ